MTVKCVLEVRNTVKHKYDSIRFLCSANLGFLVGGVLPVSAPSLHLCNHRRI